LSFGELAGEMWSGRFDYSSLNAFLSIASSVLSEPRVVGFIEATTSSEGFAARLLELVFTDPVQSYSTLAFWKNVVVSLRGILLKAYVASALLSGNEALVPYTVLLQSMLQPHPLISLYNPLVILYIAYRKPDLFEKDIAVAVKWRAVVYEALPNTVNTIVFRDYLLAVKLGDTGICTTLYNPYGAKQCSVLKNCAEASMTGEREVEAVTAYARVLKGVIEALRSGFKALNRYNEVLRGISGRARDLALIKAVERFLELSQSKLYSGLEGLIAILDALTGLGRRSVEESIAESLSRMWRAGGIAALTENCAYSLALLYAEIALFKSAVSGGVPEPFKRVLEDRVRVLDGIAASVEKMLAENREVLAKLLSEQAQPYTSLKSRLRALRERGLLNWLDQSLLQ